MIALLVLGGCGKDDLTKLPVSGESPNMLKSALINTDGNEIGEVTLAEGDNGVSIRVVAEDLGDLSNIVVEADGTVDAIVTTIEVTLQKGKENSILDEDGSTIMIHEKADDYKTDPSGNSGERIACAVIKK